MAESNASQSKQKTSGNASQSKQKAFANRFSQNKTFGPRIRKRDKESSRPITYRDPWQRYEEAMNKVRAAWNNITNEEQTEIETIYSRIIRAIDEIRKYGKSTDVEHNITMAAEALDERVKKYLNRSYLEFVNASDDTNDGKNSEGENWFFRLSEHERCFVVSAAVMLGSPLDEVTETAQELYDQIEHDRTRRYRVLSSTVVAPEPRQSINILLEHTHTTTRSEGDAERLFWKNDKTDSEVLDLICQEAGGMGLQFGNKSFLQILKDWTQQKYGNNRAWHAAYVLAFIWWQTNRDALWEVIEEWSREEWYRKGEEELDENEDSNPPGSWWGAAGLISGAYAAEQYYENINVDFTSKTLMRLQDWSNPHGEPNKQIIASDAYYLIGFNFPGIALDGLDRILQLAPRTYERAVALPDDSVINSAVFNTPVFNYVLLALQGNLPLVLQRLASHASRFAHQATFQPITPIIQHERQQRKLGAQAIERIVFEVMLFTTSGVSEESHKRYDTEAPRQPEIDMIDIQKSDPGRDSFLAAILAKGEDALLQDTITLFCAVIAIGDSTVKRGFLDILRWWADIIVRDPTPQTHKAFINFLLAIMRRASEWDQELKLEKKPGSTLRIFQNWLRSWQPPGRERDSPLIPFLSNLKSAAQSAYLYPV